MRGTVANIYQTTAKGASYRQALEAFIGVKLPSGDLAARVDNCISMEMSRKLMFNRLVFAFERTDVVRASKVSPRVLPDRFLSQTRTMYSNGDWRGRSYPTK